MFAAMASALGNLMANYTDSEGEEESRLGGSEGEGEGNPTLAERWEGDRVGIRVLQMPILLETTSGKPGTLFITPILGLFSKVILNK